MAEFKKAPGAEKEDASAGSELMTMTVDLMGTTIPAWMLVAGIGILAFGFFVYGMWERDPRPEDIEEFHPKHRGE
ncbi:MAG: hypothetical protein AAGE80_15650 [Pseudomonadota bacterium]